MGNKQRECEEGVVAMRYINKKTIVLFGIVIFVTILGIIGLFVLRAQEIKPDAAYVIKNGIVYYEEIMHVSNATWQGTRINDIPVKGADAKTFTGVPLLHGVNGVADTDSRVFSGLSNYWGKDAMNVFREGQRVVSESSTTALELTTFAPISGVFFKDAQHVYAIYYNDGLIRYHVLTGIDPKTFVLVNRQYAKDTRAVYHVNISGTHALTLIPGLDSASFRVIGVCGSAENYKSYYIADAHIVMAFDKPVSGADPATFRIVGGYQKNPGGISSTGSYSIDKSHVYANCGELVRGVLPTSCTAADLASCGLSKSNK